MTKNTILEFLNNPATYSIVWPVHALDIHNHIGESYKKKSVVDVVYINKNGYFRLLLCGC